MAPAAADHRVADPAVAPIAAPIAVVDIGSNSIRLVVYDKLGRSPLPIFNEKVLCGLGRDLALTGRLSPEGVTMALTNLRRFRSLIDGMGVGRVDVLATAAVRDADDGMKFAAEVERTCGLTMNIISGVEEARLSAMGVLSAMPQADGVMGDLGGGSLELVGLDKGKVADQATLPLGPFRLMSAETAGTVPGDLIDAELAGQDWLAGYRKRVFYPVGGAWRSIAKLHLALTGHPIHVIQEYTVPAADLFDTVSLIARQSKGSLSSLQGVSKRRLETMPLASLLFARVLKVLAPKKVVFSANGLREGHLFDQLDQKTKGQDPLIAACADVAERVDRYGFGSSHEIADWTAPLFADEADADRRLRIAAGLVSDIGWSDHPDYRAIHSFHRVLRLPVGGIEHRDRAFLALAILIRYGGASGSDDIADAIGVLTDERQNQARRLGTALRLAHTLTGGASRMLDQTRLVPGKQFLDLVLPSDKETLIGDVVRRRLDAVARAFDLEGRIVTLPQAMPKAG